MLLLPQSVELLVVSTIAALLQQWKYHKLIVISGSGAEADYVSIVAQELSFTSFQTSQALNVQINSDSFTELSETFSAVLSSVFLANTAGGPAISLSSLESDRLIRNPDSATVTILDDDGVFN